MRWPCIWRYFQSNKTFTSQPTTTCSDSFCRIRSSHSHSDVWKHFYGNFMWSIICCIRIHHWYLHSVQMEVQLYWPCQLKLGFPPHGMGHSIWKCEWEWEISFLLEISDGMSGILTLSHLYLHSHSHQSVADLIHFCVRIRFWIYGSTTWFQFCVSDSHAIYHLLGLFALAEDEKGGWIHIRGHESINFLMSKSS